jgi:aldose sugar dehydrogenase
MRAQFFPLLLLPVAAGCQGPSPAASGPAPASPQPANTANAFAVDTVVSGLSSPWALAFLPDGRILVTEKPGRLRIVGTDGRLSAPLAGVPAVYARGQGGLLDVAIDPGFATNRLVYLSYAEPGEGGAGTAVARGQLAAAGLENVQVIYRQRPKLEGGGHYGSRIVFAPDGKLFVTQGDRMNYREKAQNLDEGQGKLVRINPDGSIPSDNPFVNRSGALREIYSYGHRNQQAAAIDPATGRLWTVEHGARGGDELNQPQPGRNYGWPVITYGTDYSGARIGDGASKEGMEQPVYYWDPVIAPSGATFYTGDRFPAWRGSLFVGSLSPGGLVRLELRDGRVAREERYLGELRKRIRDVQQGPDGNLYVVTDEGNGLLLRLRPR